MLVFIARVAIIFGVSQSVTTRAWNLFHTSGSATQCHAGGQQRATTPIQNKCIVVQASRHPFENATTLRNEIRSTGLITIGILYSSPVSNVLTLQIDVLECGEDVEADFKMPICLNMTAREEAPSWFGRVSAEVQEQTHTS